MCAIVLHIEAGRIGTSALWTPWSTVVYLEVTCWTPTVTTVLGSEAPSDDHTFVEAGQ